MTLPELASSLLMAADSYDAASQVGSGRIVGGWSYVWVSYGVTWFTFAAYGLSLWVRRGKSEGAKE